MGPQEQVMTSGAARRDDAVRWLRDVLRSNIIRGAYADGQLPSEAELMVRHRSSRRVVRGALALLRDEGLIDRQQGIGTFVVTIAGTSNVRDGRVVVEQWSRRGAPADTRSRPLHRGIVPAPDAIAARLGIASGDPCLRIDYVGVVGDEPFFMATNYAAFPEAGKLATVPLHIDFYAMLHEAGITLGSSEVLLGAVAADSVTGPLLDCPPGSPLLLGEQVIRDEAGRPFDFAVVYLRGDRMWMMSYDQASPFLSGHDLMAFGQRPNQPPPGRGPRNLP
jgi:GntR family transcriptional regulator